MKKLEMLKSEVTDNAGKGGSIKWDGLDNLFGKWGAVLAKIGISALIVLVV